MAVAGVQLLGVVSLQMHGEHIAAVDGTQLVTVRELAAVVRPGAFGRSDPGDRDVDAYHEVIDAMSTHRTIVPAPVGAMFKSADQVARWLDTHYIALSEALLFLDNRCEARLHIGTADEAPADRAGRRGADREGERAESRAETAAQAAESFRFLRRSAVAAVPLRAADATRLLSGAFLVDRARWEEFATAVGEQRQRYPGMRFELTGPWPPYDFVRMQF